MSAATQQSSGDAADKKAIRPFKVSIAEEKLVDLRRRIAATQWPEKESGYGKGSSMLRLPVGRLHSTI